EAWLPALNVALKSMKLGGRAHIIVPSASLLTKTIAVPHVDAARREEVVAFEAKKNIPYDLSEVSWSYQVISDDGIETEILLASMKANEADDFCAAVTFGSLAPATLEAASILDFNAWKYCGLEENSMILNIGAKSSNLIIAHSADDFFVRSVSIGGNAITQSISDNLGKSFMQAEAVKRAFFEDPAKMESSDAVAQLLKSSIRAVAKRISTELKRSILNYKRKGAETPCKLYLSGRGSLTPGLPEYLSEELQVDVQYIDVLSSLSVAPGVNIDVVKNSSVHLSEIVGEAARMVLPASVGLNLLPRHITEENAFKRKMPWLLLSAAMLACASALPILSLRASIDTNRKIANAYKLACPSIEKNKADIDDKKEQAKALLSKIADLEVLAKSKSNWINLFADLERRIFEAKDVWLDDLKVVRSEKNGKPDYRLRLSGRFLLRDADADGQYDSAKAIKKMDELLSSFTKSAFIEKSTVEGTDTRNKRILKFNFTLVVNPDKPI
ncbi:MAG: pilus assembly protein PilM, partial [Opitutales bacterium]|nr:pilus assembly protein PilM [Opitutales bacterium]